MRTTPPTLRYNIICVVLLGMRGSAIHTRNGGGHSPAATKSYGRPDFQWAAVIDFITVETYATDANDAFHFCPIEPYDRHIHKTR